MTNESFKDGIETIMKPFFTNAVEVLVVIIPFFPRGFAQKKKTFWGLDFFFFFAGIESLKPFMRLEFNGQTFALSVLRLKMRYNYFLILFLPKAKVERTEFFTMKR